jgi:hypothetical protein
MHRQRSAFEACEFATVRGHIQPGCKDRETSPLVRKTYSVFNISILLPPPSTNYNYPYLTTHQGYLQYKTRSSCGASCKVIA